MTDNQLFKILATITEVKVHRWHVVRKIVEIFDEVEDRLSPILIQYGEGSEAQVFLHELII